MNEERKRRGIVAAAAAGTEGSKTGATGEKDGEEGEGEGQGAGDVHPSRRNRVPGGRERK